MKYSGLSALAIFAGLLSAQEAADSTATIATDQKQMKAAPSAANATKLGPAYYAAGR